MEYFYYFNMLVPLVGFPLSWVLSFYFLLSWSCLSPVLDFVVVSVWPSAFWIVSCYFYDGPLSGRSSKFLLQPESSAPPISVRSSLLLFGMR